MPYRPKNLFISTTNPEGAAACDRCSFVWNHSQLAWQLAWAGNVLVNQNILCCPKCLDIPNESTRAPILPEDPVPIKNPRPFHFDVP
jgi:hypothetical protein